MKTTADTRAELEWVIGHLFGTIACRYIADDLLEWFNDLEKPTAYELRELVGGMEFSDYFHLESDCDVDIPFFVCPENFTPAMMRGFRGPIAARFDTVEMIGRKQHKGMT